MKHKKHTQKHTHKEHTHRKHDKPATSKNYFVVMLVVGIVAAAGFLMWRNQSDAPIPADDPNAEFAKCLADSGAKMYGANWCGYCTRNKELFGSSWELFEKAGGYIECTTPEGSALCSGAGIQGYPTWVFPDGSRAPGMQNMAVLSQKSGCPLP
jgi:hypothetical protein